MVNEPNFTSEELSEIKAKTLVIAGSRDMIKASHTRLIAESIPKSELKIIRGNHFIAEKTRVISTAPQQSFSACPQVKRKENKS